MPAPADASIDDLLANATRARGGPAADALRRAGKLLRERGDLVTAIEVLQRAAAEAERGPAEPRLLAGIELDLGALWEQDLGRIDRAMASYERAFKLDPDNAAAIDAGRRVYRSLGDWRMVARLYEVELETQKERHQRGALLVELGRVLAERLNDCGQAAVRLEEAARLMPHDEGAKEALGSLYVSPDFPSSGDDDDARFSRAAQLFVELADARANKGDSDGQIAFLRRALGADPYHLDAATRLESAYLARGMKTELCRFYQEGAPVERRALKLTELAIDAGDAELALTAVTEAHEGGEDTALVLERLEELLVHDKRFAEAAALRERMLGDLAGRARADLLVDIAGHWHKVPNLERYEAALLEALAADPIHQEAFQQLSEHLTQRRDYATLCGIGEEAALAAPKADQPRRLAELAELYEKKLGDVAMAVETWRRAEQLLPSPRGQTELKRLLQKQDRWAAMTAALRRELDGARDNDQRAELLKRLAQVHRERHELDEARRLWLDALELRPGDAAIYRSLAELAERAGRQDEVANVLRRQLGAAKEKVEKLNLLRRLAVLYDERLNDLEGVEWACVEILEQLPGDRDALRRLEQAYERGGDAGEEQLIAVLESHVHAAATPAEKVPLYHRLAALYEKHGQKDKTADAYERIVKLDKSDLGAWESLSSLYEEAGRWPEAVMAYERILPKLAEGQKGVELWKRAARLLDGKLGDAVRGARAWKEVLERRPTDKEALESLSRLARQKNDWPLLDEVLARRQAHAEGDAAVALALERAELAAERLQQPARAIELLQGVIGEMAPRHVVAHQRLRALYAHAGFRERSLHIAERELFLVEDPEQKLGLAIDIAQRTPELSGPPDPKRAILAWQRVVELAPAHEQALAALGALYREIGDFAALLAVGDERLWLYEGKNDIPAAVALLFELAPVAEEKLADPERAFSYLSRALELERGNERALAELRRIAERRGLWEPLCAVYAKQPGLEARMSVAEVAADKLRDPARAFAILRGALELDPKGTRILPELERLSELANDTPGLLEIYEQLLARAANDEKVDLLCRRARARQERLRDPSGALDELVRAFPYAPADADLLAWVRGLAETTGRWDDALAVEGYRFHRAPDEDKLAIACEAAALVEEKVNDPLRAFRAYLRAFQLAPKDETIRGHLWRLARAIGEIREEPKPTLTLRPPAAAPPPPPKAAFAGQGAPGRTPFAAAPSRLAPDPTLEVALDEVSLDDVDLLVADDDTDEAPKVSDERRADATVELQLSDLVGLTKKIKRAPAPHHENGAAGRPRRLSAPALPYVMPALGGVHSAWEELALVQINLPAQDERQRFEHLLAVSEMWEKGAGDLDKAFATLKSAFKLDPDHEETRQALQALAETNRAFGRLVAVLDETIEETGNAERAVRLLNDSARVRELEGDLADAEARYQRALGMRPDDEPSLRRLEQIYPAAGERWPELATLLERRLHGMLERMTPGEDRKQRALELCDVYERMGNTYEAIDAWTQVARDYPDHEPAFAALARLYEAVGQWSKVIEALTRQLDLSGGDRTIRKRVGEIFERELELPERAIEAYGAVLHEDPHDFEAMTALERLYEKLGRWKDLDALLARRNLDRESGRIELLERRASLLADRIGDHAGAAEALSELTRLHPDDDALAARLQEALGRAGRLDEQADMLVSRIGKRAKEGAPERELARLEVELALLYVRGEKADKAERALERALAREPDNPRALAELAKLRQGGADWDGYAAAREREAEVSQDKAQRVAALVDAAKVHVERRRDDAAAKRALERALAIDDQALPAVALYGTLARRLLDDATADRLAEQELGAGPEPARRAELHAGLGASALRRGDRDRATRCFQEAITALPGYAPATEGLADLAAQAGAWDQVEALLRDAASRQGVPPQVAAQFYRRLAEAAERQDRLDDAYQALLEADRLLPGDLTTRLQLGENRYRAHRYREAAQYLAAVAEHPDAERLPEAAAEAVYHGALAELKLRRPEKAMPLIEAAVRIHPGHVAALGLLAERAVEIGDIGRGLELLELQAASTRDKSERALRFERVADAILSELNDTVRASRCYDQAVDAAGDDASVALLDKALNLQRAGGKIVEAAQTVARLLEKESQPAARARRLREAAAFDAALGRNVEALAKLSAALEIAPQEPETLAGLSAMLVQLGKDEDAAQLLTRSLALLPPPTPELCQERATLWMRLGECRERLRDARGAMTAFEKALEADPSRRPLRELVLSRYGDDSGNDAIVRGHRLMILAEDPLDAASLRAMVGIESRLGQKESARRFLELLVVAGAASDDETAATAEEVEPTGALDEPDHALLGDPEALTLAEVFAALFEGTAAELAARSPSLDSFGVGPNERVSPVSDTTLARAYSSCARMLGNRKTALYLKPDPELTELAIMAQPPTALVVGPSIVKSGRPASEVRFVLGRALEIARPEYILAAALPAPEFARLFAAILRAFHPRHARRHKVDAEQDEVQKWKRTLPYKAAKKLAELFRDLATIEFSSHRWRRAVHRTGNRAGLVACRDMVAAARVLRAEGDEDSVKELARFCASNDYLALTTKLYGGTGRR